MEPLQNLVSELFENLPESGLQKSQTKIFSTPKVAYVIP